MINAAPAGIIMRPSGGITGPGAAPFNTHSLGGASPSPHSLTRGWVLIQEKDK